MAFKVGIDVDHTITAAPTKFRALAKAVKDSGGRVIILHGGATHEATDQDMVDAQTKLAIAGFGMPEDPDKLYDAIEVAPRPHAPNKAAIAKKRKLDFFIDNRRKNAKAVRKAGITSNHFLQ